ncbi:hypothetical protein Acsp03_39410 [Actinomadura sp. NBRC 104412]|uniref:tyrosine-type recombinase/integrase n=1 Tax=Actinomadura sp. NBRC 104412 TaxID=3032203 RepID=UPI0024A5377D|nr:tyrosine-type recombinase/integrase [Actinomadura sp. NBRC 104412]GLZ06475.1 hypothetical protein Acsp03_39410 [Actinomadura sp. NBRC 104412]
MNTSYKVTFWELRPNKSAPRPGKPSKVISYTARWLVGGREKSRTFKRSAQANNFLSDLRQAAKKGEAFDVDSGLPVSMLAENKRGERMVAFFAVMYYAALRPEEAVDLRRDHLVSLPDDGWGEMRLTHAEPRSGSLWTDSGKPRDRQPLKHRAPGETRPVPIHPELVALLRRHIKEFDIPPGGRLFVGPRGGIMTDRTYLAAWHKAREKALTEREVASPLARTPYDLRHAAVSTWLGAGVPPAQVAEWAGHSVAVLLRVYAKCVAGQEEDAKHRISEATKPKDRDEGP